MIPKQLKQLSFCRIKKGSKAPFEKDWNNKPLSYNEISKFFPGENYGVLCGYHDLAVIDCDRDELRLAVEQLLPGTFSVKTGGGGKHFYYFIPELKQKIILNLGDTHLGEIQFKGQQVVGAGSLHPNGKTYDIINNVGIKTITLKKLEEVLGQFMGREEVVLEKKEDVKDYKNLIEEIVKVWKEGDRQELALSISGYLRKEKRLGINKVKSIIKEVCKITQDEELKMRLRSVDETFKKDEKNIKGFTGLGKVDLKEPLEIYDDGELISKDFPEPEWIIKNQIPKGEIGILAGKRGERKTFFALYQSLCIASGKDCVEDQIDGKKKVFYISEEDSILALLPRIKGLKKGLGIEKEKLDIKYFVQNNIKLDVKNDKFSLFRKKLEEFKPDLIIVDTLQRCVSFDVDTDNRLVSEFFTGIIRPLQKEFGCAWLFIHHLRKGLGGGKPADDLMDEIRGASEIVNYPRFVLICQVPKESKDMMVLTPVKMSYAELGEAKVVSFDNSEENQSIVVSYAGLPQEVLKKETKCADAIKKHLFEQQFFEFKTSEIKIIMKEFGFGGTITQNALKLLLGQGFLEKKKLGYYQVSGGVNRTL